MITINEHVESVYSINWRYLRKKGYNAVLFDIDNTIAPYHGTIDPHMDDLFKRLKDMGFEICILTNSTYDRYSDFITEYRIMKYGRIHYVGNAKKPTITGYRKAMNLCGSEPITTIMVGDQLLTDMKGAEDIGIYRILVEPYDYSSYPWYKKLQHHYEMHHVDYQIERKHR